MSRALEKHSKSAQQPQTKSAQELATAQTEVKDPKSITDEEFEKAWELAMPPSEEQSEEQKVETALRRNTEQAKRFN